MAQLEFTVQTDETGTKWVTLGNLRVLLADFHQLMQNSK